MIYYLFLFVLSLFVQRKNERKGAGNDNQGLPLSSAFAQNQRAASDPGSHRFRRTHRTGVLQDFFKDL
jgi:hypothetical protein